MKNLTVILMCVWAVSFAAAQSINGFDLSATSIPAEEIFHGGPPRDGIPSIDRPGFVAAADADFIGDEEQVLGLSWNGVARAYPIKILNWHEIVNDEFNGAPVAVTFCPLCGSGVAFDAEAGGQRLQFGVSGLLYNSDVLLYDRQTHSLWSQLLRRGVSGEYDGVRLQTLPVQHTTWRDWREQHPDTQMLSPDSAGAVRDYDVDPYAGYDKSEAVFFPVRPEAPQDTLHPKEWVLGVLAGDDAKAYPFSELAKRGEAVLQDQVGGQEVQIHWNMDAYSARAEWQEGENGEAVRAFWFAWFAFHPDGEIFRADAEI